MAMLPEPMSPLTENLTPSLAAAMMTESPQVVRLVQMRWNSPEGIFTTAWYSVSGMPSVSASISSSLSSKSETLSENGVRENGEGAGK